jgi:hypothetical protein
MDEVSSLYGFDILFLVSSVPPSASEYVNVIQTIKQVNIEINDLPFFCHNSSSPFYILYCIVYGNNF